jgi:hypothetical protein
MAVLQISKIQIRRGKSNGQPVPQLASGELAWSTDTQTLWIGNGDTNPQTDAAPTIGNTKVITERDISQSILDLALYQYNRHNTIGTTTTGVDGNHPVVQHLQDVLDQYVTASDFGVVGDGIANDTAAIQRAVNQLFTNLASTGVNARVNLIFKPGTYLVTSTITLPSYVTITGAGIEKTIFHYTGANNIPVFNFTSNATTNHLKGFTINTTQNATIGISLNATTHSIFEEIEIVGITASNAPQNNSIGIKMSGLCDHNKFSEITIDHTTYGIWASDLIQNNIITSGRFLRNYQGVVFGMNNTGVGPRKNTIENCQFYNVSLEGILISKGQGNRSRGNNFINVGNVYNTNDSTGNNTGNQVNAIKFVEQGNSSVQDTFDRATTTRTDVSLATSTGDFNRFVYYPEVGGHANIINQEPIILTVPHTTGDIATPLFRVPLTTAISYKINYIYRSTTYDLMRSGVLQAVVDVANSHVQLVDEFEFVLPDVGYDTHSNHDENSLIFSAAISNGSLVISYLNYCENDNSTNTSFIYTYSSLS